MKKNLEYVGLLDNKVEKELTNLHSFLQHNKKYKDKYELAQKNDDEELFNSVIDAHREKHAARKKEINEKYDWWSIMASILSYAYLMSHINNDANINDAMNYCNSAKGIPLQFCEELYSRLDPPAIDDYEYE